MSLKVKKMFLALVLMVAIPFTCGSACDESGTNSNGARGSDWLQCKSVTCTYKVKWTGDTKTAVSGVRISKATAKALKGKWVTVK